MRKLFLYSFLSMATSAQTPEARIEQIVQSYVADHKFMGTVLIAKGDNVIFDKGYGYANLEWQIPNTPDTKFRLGSVTKQFTAASILLLAERGKLKTDDPVKKYLPDAPAAWDKSPSITSSPIPPALPVSPAFLNTPTSRRSRPPCKSSSNAFKTSRWNLNRAHSLNTATPVICCLGI